jgi:hypothetical protein
MAQLARCREFARSEGNFSTAFARTPSGGERKPLEPSDAESE